MRLPFRHRIMPAETFTCLMLATLPCTYGMSVIPQDPLSTEAETCATADPDFKVHDSTSAPSRCRHRSYTMTTVAVIIVMACVCTCAGVQTYAGMHSHRHIPPPPEVSEIPAVQYFKRPSPMSARDQYVFTDDLLFPIAQG